MLKLLKDSTYTTLSLELQIPFHIIKKSCRQFQKMNTTLKQHVIISIFRKPFENSKTVYPFEVQNKKD